MKNDDPILELSYLKCLFTLHPDQFPKGHEGERTCTLGKGKKEEHQSRGTTWEGKPREVPGS